MGFEKAVSVDVSVEGLLSLLPLLAEADRADEPLILNCVAVVVLALLQISDEDEKVKDDDNGDEATQRDRQDDQARVMVCMACYLLELVVLLCWLLVEV